MPNIERGERSVFSYFRSHNKVKEAAIELINSGFKTVQVDRVSRFGVNLNSEINNPVAGGAKTITGLTLYSADTSSTVNTDQRVLLSSDPSVSGMADDYDEVDLGPFLLLAAVPEEEVQRVVGIIEKYDGRV